jgi:hypothetical protein
VLVLARCKALLVGVCRKCSFGLQLTFQDGLHPVPQELQLIPACRSAAGAFEPSSDSMAIGTLVGAEEECRSGGEESRAKRRTKGRQPSPLQPIQYGVYCTVHTNTSTIIAHLSSRR